MVEAERLDVLEAAGVRENVEEVSCGEGEERYDDVAKERREEAQEVDALETKVGEVVIDGEFQPAKSRAALDNLQHPLKRLVVLEVAREVYATESTVIRQLEIVDRRKIQRLKPDIETPGAAL